MTAVENAAVSQEELDAKAWAGFTEGNWQKDIDVRDFIQKNYTPYEGDETFLAPATEKTKHLWKYLDDNYLAVERKQRVYDVDTHTPADVDAFPAGYIDSPEVDNVVVGLQTDVPCKRAMMPNGGWRMVEQAIKEAGRKVNEDILLLGVDALDECVEMVQNGMMTGTVLNDHVGQSHTAADVAIKAAMGEMLDAYYWVDYQMVK